MPLDPQMKKILDQMAAANDKPFHQMAPAEARELMERRLPKGAPTPVARVEDQSIPGPSGPIPIRIYTPSDHSTRGALVYFHGGGWVVGSIAMVDDTCRRLANAAACVVVSVDYRLAPEHKFPAGLEDCYAAATWTVENAGRLGCAPERVAVGGSSAGGTLATATAMMARDRGGPRFACQLLIYPATQRELNTPSQNQFAADNYYILSRADMEWFWGHYLASPSDAANPYACPARAASLAGLPAAMVLTAEYDPLRDEGEAYAARLRDSGVPATMRRYDGVTHGFFGMAGVLDKARQAIDDSAAALRAAFTG